MHECLYVYMHTYMCAFVYMHIYICVCMCMCVRVRVYVYGQMEDTWMDRCMDTGMDGWVDGWVDRCMDGWMHKYMDAWMYVCMHACMHGWMDGWVDAYERMLRYRDLQVYPTPGCCQSLTKPMHTNLYLNNKVPIGENIVDVTQVVCCNLSIEIEICGTHGKFVKRQKGKQRYRRIQKL